MLTDVDEMRATIAAQALELARLNRVGKTWKRRAQAAISDKLATEQAHRTPTARYGDSIRVPSLWCTCPHCAGLWIRKTTETDAEPAQ